MSKDVYQRSRVLYLFEAALEYFISMMVTGAYLAKITSAIGVSDTVTGILAAFVSLGCGFQLFAIFLAGKRPVKRWVTALHLVNESFFALIYFVPFIKVPSEVRVAVFVGLLLVGHVLNNVVNSPKTNWFMSLVDDRKRGQFSANKEMLSLIGGMIFSFAMGAIVDRFEADGNIGGAFIVCGFAIFGLMILHSATMIFSAEKPLTDKEKIPAGKLLRELLRDRDFFSVMLIAVLWNVVNFASTPFYGSYQVKELGFSMTFISALTAICAVVRTLFSRPMGKFADKHSFAKMLNVCFVIMLAAFCVNVFTVPANGAICFPIYNVLNAIAMAGINSSMINLIYDYVAPERRVGALALKNTLAGFAGFFTTLAVSPLVARIQRDGNVLFGRTVYAQQVVSAIAAVLLVILIVYLNLVVLRMKRRGAQGE